MKGIGPKEIELTSEYRVEEFINGRPLTVLELRNPFIAEKLMHMICELNYNPDLLTLIKGAKTLGSNHSTDHIYDLEKGWYQRYIKEARPLLLKSRHIQENPRSKKILAYFE